MPRAPLPPTRLVPPDWMPDIPSPAYGIVMHWTAGAHEASSIDREHYHILIEGDGDLVKGDHSILDNWNTADGDYAAHARLCNTRWIGVSFCCMGGARENPFHPGRWPMTEIQWGRGALVVADLCERYKIVVEQKTVIAHGEIQAVLGRPQRGKWDPMKMPWTPSLTGHQVMEQFRTMVRHALDKKLPDETQRPVKIVLRSLAGREVTVLEDDGYVKAGKSFAPRGDLARALGFKITEYSDNHVTFQPPKGPAFSMPSEMRGDDRGYVWTKDFAQHLGLVVPTYDQVAGTVTLTWPPDRKP